MLTSEPGALDITGPEPRNPFALALSLSSLYLHACIHGCWSACALLAYLAFVHASVTHNSNIYRIYVDVDQALTFVAEPLDNQLRDPAATDDAVKSKKTKN